VTQLLLVCPWKCFDFLSDVNWSRRHSSKYNRTTVLSCSISVRCPIFTGGRLMKLLIRWQV